jgi:hypothetical protein
MLKQYTGNFTKKAFVIILIEYYQITQIEAKEHEKQLTPRYYRILSKRNMYDYSAKENIKFNIFPLLSAGSNIKSIFQDSEPKYFPSNNIMTVKQLQEYSEYHYKDWMCFDDTHTFSQQCGDEGIIFNKSRLCEILDFCISNDFIPILVTTPMTAIFNSVFEKEKPEFFDLFYKFTKDIINEYPFLSYFDYSHDERFTNDISLFSDGDHLNLEGSIKFTEIFLEDLQKRKLFYK